jgi:hypothetical protein
MESCLDKITNPETGRKVRLDSKKGRHILSNYLFQCQKGQRGGSNKEEKAKVARTKEQDAVSEAEFQKQKDEIQRLSKELNTRIKAVEKEHLEPAEDLARQADAKYETGRKLHREAFDSVVPKISRSSSLLRRSKTHEKDKCYRSISRGTCEPEYFFDEREADRDPKDNKCTFDSSTRLCSANYDHWTPNDRGQIVRRMASLDRHDNSDLYWSSDNEGNYRPFITHHHPKQLAEHTHGHVVH